MNFSPKSILLGSIIAGSIGAIGWQLVDETMSNKGQIRKISQSITTNKKTSSKEFETDLQKLESFLSKVENPNKLDYLLDSEFFETLHKVISESTEETEKVKNAISILQVVSQNGI
ncbi:hypothetical protein M0813_26827 [Anaeramoeba flamelloides]|uniref:Uncharacterized protein n=1 Tax=Anaeramoeba flamelloides TaxID=1746091 RepID=A0AAV8AFC8_9EUKA|nr:hypothetical protein M0812_04767 [Anaeramoeba flamelloides]KAJ6237271.1 hypothetical protein M0813_26827 [Anaeramoeba flamelloides]